MTFTQPPRRTWTKGERVDEVIVDQVGIMERMAREFHPAERPRAAREVARRCEELARKFEGENDRDGVPDA